MGSASLSPEGFVQGGGLLDDANVTLKGCCFEMFDYNGTIIPGVPALKIGMETEDGEESAQDYSMGNASDWAPSEDGKELLAIGKAKAIRTTSNGGIFLQNLVDAGYPADNLGTDISVLDGVVAHVIQIPAPKRSGMKAKTETKYEKTILVVDEIISLPEEEKKKGKKKAAPKSKGKKKAAPAETEEVITEPEEGDADLEQKTTDAIMEILAASGGSVSVKKLPGEVFQVAKADPDRNAIIKMAFEEEFLSKGPWTFDAKKGTVTL